MIRRLCVRAAMLSAVCIMLVVMPLLQADIVRDTDCRDDPLAVDCPKRADCPKDLQGNYIAGNTYCVASTAPGHKTRGCNTWQPLTQCVGVLQQCGGKMDCVSGVAIPGASCSETFPDCVSSPF